MDLGLSGRVAIVTGASKGIGKGIATALAQEGASLAICARTPGPLESAAEELRSYGVQVFARPTDVSQPEAVTRFVQETLDCFGRIDILVNNAGEAQRAQGDISDELWQEHFDQYVFSVIRFCRAVLPAMQKQQWGRIINISSGTAKEPAPTSLARSVVKAAEANYSKGLADRVAQYGITVNALAPGMTFTERLLAPGGNGEIMARKMGLSPREALEKFARETIPLGRFTTVEECGSAAAFLASEQAGGITGTYIRVDGGSSKSW
jgi:3-oxoacyl-[acyl-carrier protein] reductase